MIPIPYQEQIRVFLYNNEPTRGLISPRRALMIPPHDKVVYPLVKIQIIIFKQACMLLSLSFFCAVVKAL